MSSSAEATSSRVSGGSSRRATCESRSSSASSGRSGWRRWSSSTRYVAMTRTRSRHRLRARKATKARVEGSAQWRSSRTRTTGSSSPGARAARAAPRTAGPGRAMDRPRGGRDPPRGRWRAAGGPARRGRRAEVVEDVGAVAGQRAQRADERPVGQLALAELDRLAVQDVRAEGARAVLELGDEPALADARLARHEGERRARGSGLSERPLELRHLAGAPDEPSAGHARRHGGSIARDGAGLGRWRRR